MNTLIRHIEYLISRKDCVIIPDFGAILANNISAVYDSTSHTLYPPKRQFTFNSELTVNDALLVTSIQRAENLTYEAAQRKVKMAVDALKAQLRYKGELSLGRIGLLTYDADNATIDFLPYEATELSPSSLWLEPITLPAEEADNIIEAPIEYKPETAFRRWAKAAASIAMLLAVGFIASTPLSIDDAMLASLAPEVSPIPVEELIPAKGEAPAITISLPTPAEDSAIDLNAEQRAITEAEGYTNYYVVVASLPTDQEALQFINESSDPRLRLMSKGQYHRVYTTAHPTVVEAYRASLNEAKTYPGAWVCKK